MRSEQVSPAVIDTELPPKIDPQDPRLSRAFGTWEGFKLAHAQQIASLGTMSIRDTSLLVAEFSALISLNVGLKPEPRGILDVKKTADLHQLLTETGDKVIFMRHGEQSPPEWIASIQDPVIRKIRMMQNPFNRDDCLTNRGFVDVFATAFGLFYLQQVTQRNIQIISSENRRAKEAGEIMVNIIPGSTVSVLAGLDSISYKDESDLPPVSLEELMTDLPSGHMPWIPELVDKLCRVPQGGEKQSDLIIQAVDDLLCLDSPPGSRNLLIALTHSQQLAEVLRRVKNLTDPAIRFPELTMIAYEGQNQLHISPRGVLKNLD